MLFWFLLCSSSHGGRLKPFQLPGVCVSCTSVTGHNRLQLRSGFEEEPEEMTPFTWLACPRLCQEWGWLRKPELGLTRTLRTHVENRLGAPSGQDATIPRFFSTSGPRLLISSVVPAPLAFSSAGDLGPLCPFCTLLPFLSPFQGFGSCLTPPLCFHHIWTHGHALWWHGHLQ